jgi:uncharacterized membrane protein
MSKKNQSTQDRRDRKFAEIIKGDAKPAKMGVFARLRAYFLTGLVVAAPISITIYLTWWFVTFFDVWLKPLVPAIYNPDTYLPFSVPGVGLVFAFIALTFLGALTANLFGRTIVAYGEQMFNRMPVVRNVYRALKQIFETALSQSSSSFQDVALIEYPRKGLYAIVFVSTDTGGEIPIRSGEPEMLSVFLPTTPNPTSGYLLFVPKRDVMLLEMSVEDGAKLVISAGLVSPPDGEGADVPTLGPDAAEQLSKKAKPVDAASGPSKKTPEKVN